MIESKDEMKKKGRKSPDFADAAVYASVDLEESLNPQSRRRQSVLEDAHSVLGDDMPDYLDLMV